MKVYSWNVLCYNKKVKEVCKFIETLDFDVLCLQEITPQMLECIKTFPFQLLYHIDVIRLHPKGTDEVNYVAILSKHKILEHQTFQFPDFRLPLHARSFVRFMGIMKFSFMSDRGALYADVLVDGKKVRIFSVHLTLWGPAHRAEEFGIVSKYIDPTIPTVIAGDFNVIEYPPMKILNWLLGAPVRESLPTYPERELFEKRFSEFNFNNPLRGMVTHNFSRSQLDHILVSNQLKVISTIVQTDPHGSDHYPVGVEIEFST